MHRPRTGCRGVAEFGNAFDPESPMRILVRRQQGLARPLVMTLGFIAIRFPLHRLGGVLRGTFVIEPAQNRNFTLIAAMLYQQKNVCVHTCAFH